MSNSLFSRSALTAIAFSVMALLIGVGVWALRLLEKGDLFMAESDRAFHRGALVESIRSAELALLAYVPGSNHVRAAEDRLRAIARGSEARGELRLARSAWEALRVYDERTKYPGRGETRFRSEAEAALVRIDRRMTEKESLKANPR